MTSPPLATVRTAARPLESLRCDIAGPPELTRVVTEHLRLLGAETAEAAEAVDTADTADTAETADAAGTAEAPGTATPAGTTGTEATPGTHAQVVLTGGGFGPVTAEVHWADARTAPSRDAVGAPQATPHPREAHPTPDEATVQAATGIMSVHGRRDDGPRGLGADYAATAAGVLAVQGLLAAGRGGSRGRVGGLGLGPVLVPARVQRVQRRRPDRS